MAERASLQLKRASCTFMAAVAADPEVQKGLPQVLLPSMKGHKKMEELANVVGQATRNKNNGEHERLEHSRVHDRVSGGLKEGA